MLEFVKNLQKYGLSYYKRYYSKYQGVVVDNEDPEVLGRIKVRCEKVYGNQVPDIWLWPCGVPAGQNIGLYLIPNKGDAVWVEFLEGDSRQPIWSHGWWAKGDMIEAVKERGKKPQMQVWQSTTGQRLVLDDKNKLVRITQSDGMVFEVRDGHISLGSETRSAEPAVLGDKNADVLNELQSKLVNLCNNLLAYSTTQSTAATSVPFTIGLVAGYSALLSSITALIPLVIKIATMIPLTKSDKVSLD